MSFTDTGYLCHECGNGLDVGRTPKMWWCPHCRCARRTPTRPTLMSKGRWELTLTQRALAHVRPATPSHG